MSHCLHICNQSPFQNATLEQALSIVSPKQVLVLIEDGVYGTLESAPTAQKLNALMDKGLKCYALDQDIEARGLSADLNNITIISMLEFVDLTAQHNPVQSWY